MSSQRYTLIIIIDIIIDQSPKRRGREGERREKG